MTYASELRGSIETDLERVRRSISYCKEMDRYIRVKNDDIWTIRYEFTDDSILVVSLRLL